MTAALPTNPTATAAAFPLERYFARIGYQGPRAATLEVLQRLHALHPQAIAYENLDPLVGNPVSIAPDDLVAKLLSGNRGGYCFEQNGLFALALSALGFSFVGLAARVLWNQPEDLVTARSHHVLLIDLPEGRYIADVGFGSMTPTAALQLIAGTPQTTSHGVMRLDQRGENYFLQARLDKEGEGPTWKTLYRFDLAPQHPADYIVGNHYVSTFAESIFRTSLMAARPVADGRITVGNNCFTHYALDGTPTETLLESAAAIRAVLQAEFDLTVADTDRFDRRVIELGFVAR